MAIAICGMADGRILPEGCELWGMPWDPEWTVMDVMFDMHHPCLMPDAHSERLREVWVPLYMQDEFYPNAQIYPIDDVIQTVGDYFSCSVSYMIALAIYQDVKDIFITGVSGSEDYSSQRPSIEYLIGMARGKGLNVEILGDTELFSGKRYGYI